MRARMLSTIGSSILVLLLLAGGTAGAAGGPDWLWQIGKPDGDDREFALAPGGYSKFAADGFFVVGHSDPAKDWPYVHPGPGDGWAGGKPHTFRIFFSLDRSPTAEATLAVALVDTHRQRPPKLRLRVNGTAFERAMPPGGGDESVKGDPSRGKPHRFEVTIRATLLAAGGNVIDIENVEGSWILYDWIGLSAPGARMGAMNTLWFIRAVAPVRALVEKDGRLHQPIAVSLHWIGEATEAVVRVDFAAVGRRRIEPGRQTFEVLVPAVESEKVVDLEFEAAGEACELIVTQKPVPKLVVYILPHSHTDIGYTEIQTKIEERQVENLVQGIEHARRTASYPPGARFIWNVEVLWAADLYLRRLPDARRAEFREALKAGWIGLNGMYLNELTGLCRPEELLRLFRYSKMLEREYGVSIDSAMISDVPGYTWGTVTAMAQAGIRYFSVAPNYFDRIGTILREWENKPFWWVGPDGRSKVLVWIPFWGYALSHRVGKLSPAVVEDFLDGLERRGYPYEIAHIRWSGHGDNAIPDPAICEFVKEWNAKHAYPKFIIATTSEAFGAFEKRYGAQLPEVRGDWTPYWEDGAGSSAAETALNRAAAERLAQAERLFALRDPTAYPAAEFVEAWDKVLLYSEHTWGAHCSVWGPERQETREQWEIKRGYALEADARSRVLLEKALARSDPRGADTNAAIDVYNTTSWQRTDLVILPKALSAAGDRVIDEGGQPVPSQRLASGGLAFIARDVPPFAARRFRVSAGAAHAEGTPASARGAEVGNGIVRVRVDEKTGAIVDLRAQGIEGNFVDSSSGYGINEYLYLIGDDLAQIQRVGEVRISVREPGPLVASLAIESDALGCRRLVREVRLIAGLDRVDLIDAVDKKRHGGDAPPDRFYKRPEGKESVNFAFPFAVKDGVMRIDIPYAVIVPWKDLMPSACKNWFTAGRWADVSGAGRGITWATLDAPLVEVGGITATLLESQSDPDVWRKTVEPTQTLYSWAMNNHWGTNYRAYQEGLVVFRYSLRPHRGYDPIEATRFGTGLAQPLIVMQAVGAAPSAGPRLRVEPEDVIVTALKPADDGKGWIVRLFGASGETRRVRLIWSDPVPKRISISDLSEAPGPPVEGEIDVPAWGLVTLRADR